MDLNDRIIVGIDSATGLPNASVFTGIAEGFIAKSFRYAICRIPCKWFGIRTNSSSMTFGKWSGIDSQ